MRVALLAALCVSAFYAMTALVYEEGGFNGALVVKPRPMFAFVVGGGEAGAWARSHPNEPAPWFQRNDLRVLTRFSWEEGEPAWVAAYTWGILLMFAGWLVLAVAGAVRLVRRLARR